MDRWVNTEGISPWNSSSESDIRDDQKFNRYR